MKIGILKHGGVTRNMITVEIGRASKRDLQFNNPEEAMAFIRDWMTDAGIVLPSAEAAPEGISTEQHATEALRWAADQPCNRSNCGSGCLCGPCHARKAIRRTDPDYRPRETKNWL